MGVSLLGYGNFPMTKPLEKPIKIMTVSAESNEAVLAVLGSEVPNFDLDKMDRADETSERFQCIVNQFNLVEVVAYIVHRGKTTWVVFNREFVNGQVIDMGIEWGEQQNQVIHAYDSEDDAMKCALGTVACYIGLPNLVVDLVNE